MTDQGRGLVRLLRDPGPDSRVVVGLWIGQRRNSEVAPGSPLHTNETRLELDPPSDHSIDVSQRAEFNGLLSRVVPCRVFVFGVFRPQSADRPKKFSGFPFPNTTKAQTQMEAPLVGVQGHQKQLENTKVLMEIDVFVCLVVQEPGVPGGFAPPDPP